MKIRFILFALLSSSAAAVGGNGHIGVMGGYGALSSSSWPVVSYGATVAARGARGGELALNYINNSVLREIRVLYWSPYYLPWIVK